MQERKSFRHFEDVDVNDPNFWFKVEQTKSKVLKWNPSGKYNRVFTPEQKKMLDIFHDLPSTPEIHIGDVMKGMISSITKNEVIIDINYKDSIYVNLKSADLKIVQNLEIGDEIDVMITDIVDNPYQICGSITELIKIDVANKLKNYYHDNVALVAKVTEMIPAGFMLEIEMDHINLTAFMPNTLAGVNKLTDYQSRELLGKKINVMLETLQQEKGVYVVSRKKYLQSLIPEEIKKLKRDTVYSGIVTGTKDFGVFIEFNECLTGMIHKVNINPEWQDRITSIQPGTYIEFYIRDILKGNRIILTQIPDQDSLWDSIRVGQIKDGVVKAVKPFGALVALDSETTGLIQNFYLEKAGVTLKDGDAIKVKIISVIKDDRKIYLGFPEK